MDIKVSGLYGVKMHPELQRFDLDDEKVIKIYKKAAKYALCSKGQYPKNMSIA